MPTIRSFILKEMPNLNAKSPQTLERHFLYRQDGIELWVERLEDKFELHRNCQFDFLNNQKIVLDISAGEFETLKRISIGTVVFSTFQVQTQPQITIKVFQVPLPDFTRIDVEFETEEEAAEFEPLEWFGDEITGRSEANDVGLTGMVI